MGIYWYQQNMQNTQYCRGFLMIRKFFDLISQKQLADGKFLASIEI